MITVMTESIFPEHSEYKFYKNQVQRCTDVIAGSDVIKEKGTEYLPRLSGQTDDEYKAYKNRALFFNITSRILSTNVGVIVRRTPTLKYNSVMKPYFENDTLNIVSFNELFRSAVRNLTSKGRVAVLIDTDNERNLPLLKLIPTENIINWEIDDNGRVIQVLLRLCSREVDPETFVEEISDVYYRLHLVDGIYTISEYTGNNRTASKISQPAILGKKLNYIPMPCCNLFGADISPSKSPIIEIVDINLSHYLSSADLENGRHFVGLPTPYVTGATSETKLHVGGTTAWVIPSEKAHVGYLEFLGQGLDSLSRALTEKQAQMAQFSAQLMDTSSKGSEAEGTVRLRYSSDSANLSDIALSTETLLNTAYAIVAEWIGTEKPSIELNKDFISTKMSYNELLALHKSFIEGSISEEVFIYNLQRGEISPTTIENVIGKPPVTEKVVTNTEKEKNDDTNV